MAASQSGIRCVRDHCRRGLISRGRRGFFLKLHDHASRRTSGSRRSGWVLSEGPDGVRIGGRVLWQSTENQPRIAILRSARDGSAPWHTQVRRSDGLYPTNGDSARFRLLRIPPHTQCQLDV